MWEQTTSRLLSAARRTIGARSVQSWKRTKCAQFYVYELGPLCSDSKSDGHAALCVVSGLKQPRSAPLEKPMIISPYVLAPQEVSSSLSECRNWRTS